MSQGYVKLELATYKMCDAINTIWAENKLNGHQGWPVDIERVNELLKVIGFRLEEIHNED